MSGDQTMFRIDYSRLIDWPPVWMVALVLGFLIVGMLISVRFRYCFALKIIGFRFEPCQSNEPSSDKSSPGRQKATRP